MLQAIPRLIFQLLSQLSEASREVSVAWPSRISYQELHAYATKSDGAALEVASVTQRVALLMRGIRETEVALVGVIQVEPKVERG